MSLWKKPRISSLLTSTLAVFLSLLSQARTLSFSFSLFSPLSLFPFHNRVKKLPLVDADNILRGLITSKDIINHIQRPFASLDAKVPHPIEQWNAVSYKSSFCLILQGRLLVGAAVGVKDGFIER